MSCNSGKLSRWVNTQRASQKNGELSEERKKILDSIGFEWHRKGTRTVTHQWETVVAELKVYKSENGHCNVMQSSGKLGRWVRNQRYSQKREELSEERKKILDDTGFRWGKS